MNERPIATMSVTEPNPRSEHPRRLTRSRDSTRNTTFRPTVIEQFRRSERALVSVIQEAFVAGSSTRRVEDVLAKMGIERLAKSQIMEEALTGGLVPNFTLLIPIQRSQSRAIQLNVSELCTELDARAQEFRQRALTGQYPYIWLDALYEKTRLDAAVVNNAVVMLTGVTASSFRNVIGIDVVDTESKESWAEFLRGLRRRRLKGTKLVIQRRPRGG